MVLTPIYTCIKGTTFLNSTSCMYLHLTHHGHPSQTHPEDLWEHLETQSFPEQEWQSESAVLLWVWSEQPTARKTHCPHLTFHFTVSCCVYNIFHFANCTDMIYRNLIIVYVYIVFFYTGSLCPVRLKSILHKLLLFWLSIWPSKGRT